MYFFGFNESFAGKKGLGEVSPMIVTKLVKETQAKDYGRGNPRVVLVSPIAFEATGDPNLARWQGGERAVGDVHQRNERSSGSQQVPVLPTSLIRRWHCLSKPKSN